MTVLRPQKGPQERFLSSPADVVIYGGAAGGGKSYALLMEPLRHINNPKFGAVIFRRVSTQIFSEGGLWDNSQEIYGGIGEPRKTPNARWVFPSGAKVSFSHIENDVALHKWQGSQICLLCCEENTGVRMADGTIKPLSQIEIGDMVETLQGPQRVTAKGERKLKDCVEIELPSGEKQIHSTDHSILTRYGWVSYDECISYGSHQPLIYAPIQCYSVSEYDQCSPQKSQGLQQPLYNLSGHRQQCHGASQPIEDHQVLPGTFSCKDGQDPGSYFESFECGNPESLQRVSDHLGQGHPLQADGSEGDISFLAQSHDGLPYVRYGTSVEDYRGNCLEDSCPYGVLAQWKGANAQGSVLQLNDAVVHNPTVMLSDEKGKAHKHNHIPLRYFHPYTDEELLSEAGHIEFQPLKITPIGKKYVVDLTISSSNHYITKSGLVNKNCFDELTHFSKQQFFYMLSRNRSTCGVKPYVRATCNPDCDSFVAELIAWWIDQDTGYPIPERSGVIRYFGRLNDEIIWGSTKQEVIDQCDGAIDAEDVKSFTFIASTLQDNQILLKTNPGYMANLKALATVERERLLHGNWKIRPAAGLYFPRNKVNLIDTIPDDVKKWVRAWDLAATEDKKNTNPEDGPAYTAGVLIGKRKNGRIVIADVINRRMNSSDVRQTVLNTAKADKAAHKKVKIRLSQDPGQAGKEQAEQYIKMLAGFSLSVVRETGSKETRAEALSAQWIGIEGAETGNVDVLVAPWTEAFLSQMESFPESKFKDMADASANGYNELEKMNTSSAPSSSLLKKESYWR